MRTFVDNISTKNVVVGVSFQEISFVRYSFHICDDPDAATSIESFIFNLCLEREALDLG